MLYRQLHRQVHWQSRRPVLLLRFARGDDVVDFQRAWRQRGDIVACSDVVGPGRETAARFLQLVVDAVVDEESITTRVRRDVAVRAMHRVGVKKDD